MPEPHDPNRLMRFVARHALEGAAAGWATMLALLWLDVGGIGELVRTAEDRTLITLMMAGAFGFTFSLLGIAYGVLAVLPREDEGGRR